jgi:hypothetical protein
MSNSQNRARARARYDRVGGVTGPTTYDSYATRPETAVAGWSAASYAGVTSRPGPRTDHFAVLVRRARRREAMRRALRLWLPRRQSGLPGVPTEVSVRGAVQTGLTVALPRQMTPDRATRTTMATTTGASYALRQQAWHAAHPMAERRRGTHDRRRLDEAHAGPERRGAIEHSAAGRRHIDLPQQRSRSSALVREG